MIGSPATLLLSPNLATDCTVTISRRCLTFDQLVSLANFLNVRFIHSCELKILFILLQIWHNRYMQQCLRFEFLFILLHISWISEINCIIEIFVSCPLQTSWLARCCKLNASAHVVSVGCIWKGHVGMRAWKCKTQRPWPCYSGWLNVAMFPFYRRYPYLMQINHDHTEWFHRNVRVLKQKRLYYIHIYTHAAYICVYIFLYKHLLVGT